MNFKTLCEFFELIKYKKNLQQKSIAIKEQMRNFRSFALLKPEDERFDLIFSIMRLIVPKLDRDRSTYNMKQARISKILIKMLSLPEGNDKNKLTKGYQHSGVGEEFSEIIYTVLRKYIRSNTSTLTIDELNKTLDDITQRESDAEADRLLLGLFKKCSPEDAKWIIKIILREMRLGIDADKILNCYHPDGSNLYSTNNNLRKVCEILFDPNVKLNEIEINIFEAFRPMLSKRLDKNSFKKEILDENEYILENKFDGERFQVHMENNKFMYFSRKAFNYSSTFGETFDSGNFTPKLKGVIHEDINRIILDGEMMLYNKYKEEYGSKGMTLDVKKLSDNGAYQPCFVIYDILMVNDTVLTTKPLKERLEILNDAIVKEIPGVIAISKFNKIKSQVEIVNALNSSMDNEEEGIIIKNPMSEYKCAQRNAGWYKMKMEYFSDVMNDMDLVLMGGSHTSSDTQKLNTFYVGIKSADSYACLVKISSGLTYEQLDMLDKKLKNEGHPFEEFESKNNGRYMFGKDTPQYWIDPEKTVVFVVRATELIRTADNSVKTPYTLRFPRILQIRSDKPVHECMDINDLLDLSQQHKPVIKLNKRHITLQEILTQKPRINLKRARLIMPKMEDLGERLDILKNYTIHVLNGTEEKSKDFIEDLVAHVGGKISYRLDEKVDIVIVGQLNEKFKNVKFNPDVKYDLIHVDWLLRIIENKALLSYEPEEVLGVGFNYKNKLCDKVDVCGDGYVEDATEDSLNQCFRNVKKIKTDLNANGLYSDLLEERFKMQKYNVYFDKFEEINNSGSKVILNTFLDEVQLRYYRGTVSPTVTSDVNLIICYSEERTEKVRDWLERKGYTSVDVTTPDFLYI